MSTATAQRLVRAPAAQGAAWSAVLGCLLLGPALRSGFVLSFDMVWVPHLALRRDALGLGSALPRAVPSDAVVAVLDDLVPAALLQKVVLLGALVLAGAGAGLLVRHLAVLPRLAATTVYVWNPYVVERQLIGHWPLLLGYAVLPWIVVAARTARSGGTTPWLAPLVVLGSLSPSAGLVTATALACCEVRAGAGRRVLRLAGLVLAANAPWVLAGLLHSGVATSSGVAARVFALHGSGALPGPLAALALDGIWNAEVVPASRGGVLAPAGLVVLLALAAAGVVRWWRRRENDGPAVGLVVAWALGWGWAVLTWLAPGASGWLATTVPGGGVMRDGARSLALCAPLLAVLVAHGVASLASLLREPVTRALVAGLLVLAPLALLPDAAWGAGGRLSAVDYPASYARVRALVTGPGDVLLLPFTSYRAPDWNGGRKVLDPLGRYLAPDVVSSDVLVVDGRALPGEDPRARQVAAALAGPDPVPALARAGIGTVVVDAAAPGSPALPGARVRLRTGGLVVLTVPDPVRRGTPARDVVVMTAAWTAYVVGPVLWVVLSRRRRRPAAGVPGRVPPAATLPSVTRERDQE